MTHEAKFRVNITSPKGVLVDETNLSETDARAACERVLAEHPTDKTLQSQLSSCLDSLGFRGYGGKGYSITISAGLPRIPTGEKLACPLRLGYRTENPEVVFDEWVRVGDDRCCSYCGSLHPDRVLEIIRSHGKGAIDQGKPGKWWVRRPEVPNAGFGGLKFYHEHGSPAFATEALELLSK